MNTRVAIVGGGLAGLHAASLLQAEGVEFLLIEGRAYLGGRILSVDETQRIGEGFDLGPSWFWPDSQPRMAHLVRKLGLSTIPQNSVGDVVFERMSREKPQRYRAEQAATGSVRIAGGTMALAKALTEKLPNDRLRLSTRVTQAAMDDSGVTLTLVDVAGRRSTLRADQVIAAVPPRLLEATVEFTPAIEPETARLWQDTATWMAPHAKFFALYDRPFWREAGLSGTAQSMVGPLVEIHDATTASGAAALFGFVGVGADERRRMGKDALAEAALVQLERLFGPEAKRAQTTLFKDWAADDHTAVEADRMGGGHPAPRRGSWVSGPWQERLSLAGSETSETEPGYLEGALEASSKAVAGTLTRLS
ncbi:MAG: flavin monoamine oxidase family protein [Fimbriimonas sp.]